MAEQTMEVLNPYAVTPAEGVSVGTVGELPTHETGNVLAANAQARAIANVRANVISAKEFPRNPMQSVDRILVECQRPTLADAAIYNFPRGKENVTGPSIRLAEVLARNWGNMTYGYEVLERRAPRSNTLAGAGASVIRAYAWDYETNVVIERQFEAKHWRTTKNGGYPITDDRDIYELEANMASRRVRACILQLIPGDVTQAAVMACRRTASNGLNEMMADATQRDKLIRQMLNIFAKKGVTQDDLEGYLNVRAADWNADHMLRLKEVKTSLDDNTVPLGDYFPRLAVDNQNATITKQQVKQLMEAAKATGMQGAISDDLKKMGIAKFADVPVGRFDDVLALIQSYGETVEKPAEKPADAPEKQGKQDTAKPAPEPAAMQQPQQPQQLPEPQQVTLAQV